MTTTPRQEIKDIYKERKKHEKRKKKQIIPSSEWSGVANIVVGEHATPRCPRTDTLLFSFTMDDSNLTKYMKHITPTEIKFKI